MTVTIRRAEPSDAKAIQQIYQSKNAYTGTLQLPHPSLEMWEKRISNVPDNVYAYVALIEGEVVGNCAYRPSRRCATGSTRRHYRVSRRVTLGQ